MALLSKQDIETAQSLELINIGNLTQVNATSIDVRISKLLTPAMERGNMRDVPLVDNEYWLVCPGDYYLFETVEDFSFAP